MKKAPSYSAYLEILLERRAQEMRLLQEDEDERARMEFYRWLVQHNMHPAEQVSTEEDS